MIKEVRRCDTKRIRFDILQWLVNADTVAHIAGYAAVGLTDRSQNGSSALNAASFNPIFHVLYKDIALAEAELEIATDG